MPSVRVSLSDNEYTVLRRAARLKNKVAKAKGEEAGFTVAGLIYAGFWSWYDAELDEYLSTTEDDHRDIFGKPFDDDSPPSMDERVSGAMDDGNWARETRG